MLTNFSAHFRCANRMRFLARYQKALKKGSSTLSFNRRQQFKQFLTVLTGAAAAENETATAAGGSFA